MHSKPSINGSYFYYFIIIYYFYYQLSKSCSRAHQEKYGPSVLTEVQGGSQDLGYRQEKKSEKKAPGKTWRGGVTGYGPRAEVMGIVRRLLGWATEGRKRPCQARLVLQETLGLKWGEGWCLWEDGVMDWEAQGVQRDRFYVVLSWFPQR